MTIAEAIENWEGLSPFFHRYLHQAYEKAYRLSIEALKMLLLLRSRGVSSISTHLKGETEEKK